MELELRPPRPARAAAERVVCSCGCKHKPGASFRCLCATFAPQICCDGCSKWQHLSCLGLTDMDVPFGDWFCRACSSLRAVSGAARSVSGSAIAPPKATNRRPFTAVIEGSASTSITDTLSTDVLIYLLQFLGLRDLGRAAQSSFVFRDAVRRASVWRRAPLSELFDTLQSSDALALGQAYVAPLPAGGCHSLNLSMCIGLDAPTTAALSHMAQPALLSLSFCVQLGDPALIELFVQSTRLDAKEGVSYDHLVGLFSQRQVTSSAPHSPLSLGFELRCFPRLQCLDLGGTGISLSSGCSRELLLGSSAPALRHLNLRHSAVSAATGRSLILDVVAAQILHTLAALQQRSGSDAAPVTEGQASLTSSLEEAAAHLFPDLAPEAQKQKRDGLARLHPKLEVLAIGLLLESHLSLFSGDPLDDDAVPAAAAGVSSSVVLFPTALPLPLWLPNAAGGAPSMDSFAATVYDLQTRVADAAAATCREGDAPRLLLVHRPRDVLLLRKDFDAAIAGALGGCGCMPLLAENVPRAGAAALSTALLTNCCSSSTPSSLTSSHARIGGLVGGIMSPFMPLVLQQAPKDWNSGHVASLARRGVRFCAPLSHLDVLDGVDDSPLQAPPNGTEVPWGAPFPAPDPAWLRGVVERSSEPSGMLRATEQLERELLRLEGGRPGPSRKKRDTAPAVTAPLPMTATVARMHLYTAFLYDKLYRWDDATAHCLHVVQRWPSCGTAHLQLACLAVQSGSPVTEEGSAEVDARLSRAEAGALFFGGDTFCGIWHERGVVRIRQRRYAEAARSLMVALKYAPCHPTAVTAGSDIECARALALALTRLLGQRGQRVTLGGSGR